jgi:hypothetical protein
MRHAAEARLAPLQMAVANACRGTELWLWWALDSRPCHAARARKLRRRGMDVRFDGCTSTGKARYRWAKPMPAIVGDATLLAQVVRE